MAMPQVITAANDQDRQRGGVPLTAQLLQVLRQHKEQMEQLALYDPYGLVCVAPTSYSNIYDHLVGRVWKRSLEHCGLKARRLYAQRQSFLLRALR